MYGTRTCIKRVRQFNDLMKNNSLQDFLNIPKKDKYMYTNIKFVNIKDNFINLTITYINKPDFVYIKSLPFEINTEINKYIHDFIDLHISISIPDDYPFKPIKWVITKINTSYAYNIYKCILKFYCSKIKHYNTKLENHWCMAHSIDKEILNLIVMLGDVKKLVDHFYQ